VLRGVLNKKQKHAGLRKDGRISEKCLSPQPQYLAKEAKGDRFIWERSKKRGLKQQSRGGRE